MRYMYYCLKYIAINFSENLSVGKFVRGKMYLSENLFRKICFGKFGVEKFVIGKISGYRPQYDGAVIVRGVSGGVLNTIVL